MKVCRILCKRTMALLHKSSERGSASGMVCKRVAGLTATEVGVVVGGAQGAVAAGNEEFNNRQLHPDERKLVHTLVAKSRENI